MSFCDASKTASFVMSSPFRVKPAFPEELFTLKNFPKVCELLCSAAREPEKRFFFAGPMLSSQNIRHGYDVVV